MIDISVIIASRNRCKSLQVALESLLSQRKSLPFSYEIIVVDNHSTDATREMIQQTFLEPRGTIRYLFEGRIGKSRALNRALQGGRGRIFAFTDDDTTPDSHWLNSIYAFFKRNPEAAAQGRILLPPTVRVPGWMDDEMLQKLAVTDWGEQECEYSIGLVGANMAVPAWVFKKIGSFCESLGPGQEKSMCGEDNELSLRIRKAGIRQVYVPSMIVYHRLEPYRLEKSYLRKITFWQGYSAMHFMKPEDSNVRYFFYQLKWMAKELAICFAHACAGHIKKAFRYELNVRRRAGILKGILASGGSR